MVERRSRQFEFDIGLVSIPNLINQYNNYMGGVDLFDQKLKNHTYEHRCIRCPHVFWHLYRQMALNNCFVIHSKAFPDKKIESKKFKLIVIRSLLNCSEDPKPQVFVGCASAELVWIDGQTKRKRKDCVICKNKRQNRSQVTRQCSNCSLPLWSESLTWAQTCFQEHIRRQLNN